MVVETRRRAGRGVRKSRGHDNHQQLFSDHIKHRNEVRRFEKSLNGNQNVKIKQEKVDGTVGDKYLGIDTTQNESTSDKDRKLSNEVIEIVENPCLEGIQADAKLSSSNECTASDNGSTGENNRVSTDNRGAKRSRRYYQDIREFIQNSTKITQDGEMFQWETIDNEKEGKKPETSILENTSEVLETAMESIMIDNESSFMSDVEEDTVSEGYVDEQLSCEEESDEENITMESVLKESYIEHKVDHTGKASKTVTSYEEKKAKSEKATIESSLGELTNGDDQMDENEMLMDEDPEYDNESSEEAPHDNEQVDDNSDADTMRASSRTISDIVKKQTNKLGQKYQSSTTVPTSVSKTKDEAVRNNIDNRTNPDTLPKKKKVMFDNLVQTKTYNVTSEANATDNTNHNLTYHSTNRYQSQVKGTLQKFNLIAKATPLKANTMKERGYRMVEEKTLLCTPVKIEFNMDRNVFEFNVREHAIKLLDNMKIVDKELKVNSTSCETKEWENTKNLPENEDFNQHFQVREFTYRKLRKVLVHLKLVTSVPIHKIKYVNPVKEYIFQNNVWIKTDYFNTKIESSPGIITMVNPKLINRDDYNSELKADLEKAQQKLVQMENTDGNGTKLGESNESTGGERSIPQFQLESSVKKWGGINVEVLRINSAKEDAEYLKQLLSIGSEHGVLTRGLFVPAGLHLMEGKEVVSNILLEHESYLQQSVGIPVAGLSHTEMTQQSNSGKTAKDLILQIPGVESVEKSRDFLYTGQWIIVTRKKFKIAIEQYIESNLQNLYQTQIGQAKLILVGNNRINGEPPPTNKIATYAEILSQRYVRKESTEEASNIQEENLHGKSEGSTQLQSNKKEPVSIQGEKNEKIKTHPREFIKNDYENDELKKKILHMEETQARLLETQRELQCAQKTTAEKYRDIEKVTDLTKAQEKFEEKMEHKLLQFQQEHKNLITENCNSIKDDLKDTWNTKMDKISVTVANQVAAQLVQVVQQYMLQERGQGININTTPLLHDDVRKDFPKITQGDIDIASEAVKEPKDYVSIDNKNTTKDNPNETSSNKRSFHDKTSERVTVLK